MRMLRAAMSVAFTIVVLMCGLGAPLLAAAAQGAPEVGSDQQNRIRITIDHITPQLVTTDQSDTVTITGTLTNVGDRKVDDVELRLERGSRITSEDALRAALAQPASTTARQTLFHKVADTIVAGQSIPFTIKADLRSASADSLQVTNAGAYPIMVNANGLPDYGQEAKVGMAMTLLPVLSLPGAAVAVPPTPTKISMLWPLSDRPHIQSDTQPDNPVFTDNDLTTSLAKGGRLEGLVAAAESLPPALSDAVCFAIDPDLLGAVQAMTKSYQVHGADGKNEPGTGQSVAKAWLDRLKLVTQGKCVLTLPFADADINSLSSANASTLAEAAISDSNAAVIQQILGVSPVRHAVWPGQSAITEKSLAVLTASKATTVLVSSAGLQTATPATLGSPGGPQAIPTDDLVTTAMSNADSSLAATVSALLIRADTTHVQPLVIAPPHQWNISADQLSSLSAALQTMISGHYFATEPAGQLFTEPKPNVIAQLPTSAVATGDASATLADRIAATATSSTDLLNSMEQDPSLSISPTELMKPVTDSLLRSASSSWHGDEAGGTTALGYATDTLNLFRSQVGIVQPRSPLSLASEDSPLLVTVFNNLPVQVKVKLDLSNATGLNPGPLPVQLIPAHIQRSIQVTSKVVRTGKFSIAMGLTTPGGTRLGQQAQLELTSTAYGTITVIVTGIAAAALVALSSRRIYRRIKRAQQRKANTTTELEAPTGSTAVADERVAHVAGDERSSKS